MTGWNYRANSNRFLLACRIFRKLKKQNRLTRNEKKEIEKKLRVVSYWLLLNTPENKNNSAILRGRINLCLNDFKKFNTEA